MKVTDPNPTSCAIFAKNAKDVIVSGENDSRYGYDFSATGLTSPVRCRGMAPDREGNLSILFKEMLSSVDIPRGIPEPERGTYVSTLRIALSLVEMPADGEESVQTVEHRIISGGVVDSAYEEDPGGWFRTHLLSVAGQKQRIYPWSRFYFTDGLPDDMRPEYIRMVVTAVCASGRVASEEYRKGPGTTYCFDVETAFEWATSSDPTYQGETVKSLSFALAVIDGETGVTLSEYPELTYEVVEDRNVGALEFVYRNSLGGIDILHSRGRVSYTPDYEFPVSSMRDRDMSLRPSVKEKITVDTGRLESEAEMKQWLEFFCSQERYVFDNSGRPPREIILDSVSPTFRAYSAESFASFEFHEAERYPGPHMDAGDDIGYYLAAGGHPYHTVDGRPYLVK